MFEKLADSISSHRLRWTLIVAVITLGLGSGMRHLSPDMTFTAFFSGDDPAKAVMDRFKDYWGADDGTLIVLIERTNGMVLEPQALEHLAKLSDAIGELEFVESVTALTTMDRMRSDETSLIVENIYDTMPMDADALRAWQEAILNDTTIVPSILRRDGMLTAVMAKIAVPADDIQTLIPLVDSFRETIAPFDNAVGFSLSTAGIPAIRKDFSEAFFRDQAVFGFVGGLLVLVVLFKLLHSVQGIVVTGFAATVPLIMLLGLMGFDGSTIDVVNQCLITVLPAIAAADAIHLISRFHEEARQLAPAGQRMDAATKAQALRRSLKHLGRACFLTSLTTAVGFASLYFAEMPILRQFGLYAAAGVCFAYLSVLCLVPLVLHWTRGNVEKATAEDNKSATEFWISRVVAASIARPGLSVCLAVLIALMFGYFSTWVKVNNHLSQTLNDEHPTSIASKVVDQKMGGILQSAIDISGPPGTLKRPDVLQALDRFLEGAKDIEDIRAVSSPATLIREAHGKLTGKVSIPDDPNAIAQLFLLIENHSEIENMLSLDYTRGRAVLTSEDIGALGFEETEAKLRALMAEHLALDNVTFELTGTPVVAYRGINRVTEDLRGSLLFAFLVVATVIAIVFRSVRIALVSLVPNGLPLLVGYGTLGLLDYRLDPTAALIFTVGLGIAVDDTIHLLARFREVQSQKVGVDEAIIESVAESGRAILVTTIVLVIGIGTNLLSAFSPIQAMALAGVTIISAAFVCDITVLPVLLKFISPRDSATHTA